MATREEAPSQQRPVRPAAPRLLRSFGDSNGRKPGSRGRTVAASDEMESGFKSHDKKGGPSVGISSSPEDAVKDEYEEDENRAFEYSGKIEATQLLNPDERPEDVAEAVARLTAKFKNHKPNWTGQLMDSISKEALQELRALFFRRKDEPQFTSPISNRHKDGMSPPIATQDAFAIGNEKQVFPEEGRVVCDEAPETKSEAGLLSHGQDFDFDMEEPASLSFDAFVETFGDILGELSPQTVRELEMLFMKIDANSDGGVDWEEFTNFIIAVDKGIQSHMHDPTLLNLISVSEKYPVMMHRGGKGCMIDCMLHCPYVHGQRNGAYISAARDGLILLWDPETMRVIRPIKHEKLIKDYMDSHTREKAARLGKKAPKLELNQVKAYEMEMRAYEEADDLLVEGGVLKKVVERDDEFSNATDVGVDVEAEMQAMEADVLKRADDERNAVAYEKKMAEMDTVQTSRPLKAEWIQCMSFLPRSQLLVAGSSDRIIAFYDLSTNGFPVKGRLIGKTPKEQAQALRRRELRNKDRALRETHPHGDARGGILSGSDADSDSASTSMESTLTNKWEQHRRAREGGQAKGARGVDDTEYDFLDTPPAALTCAIIDNELELFTWGQTNGELHMYLLQKRFHFATGCKNPKTAPGVRRAKCVQMHTDQVTHLEYIPEVEYLVSASLDSTVIFFNVIKMEPLRIFTAHTAGVRCFAYSKTAKFMVSVGQAPTRAMVWNPAGGSVECCKHGKPSAKPGNGKCRKCDEIAAKRGNIMTVAEETAGDFTGSSFTLRGDKRFARAQRRLAATADRMSGRPSKFHSGAGGGAGGRAGGDTAERCSVMSVIEGHGTTVVHVVMDDQNGRFITVSEDKVIKCHDYNTLRCMQTLHDRYVHMPENTLSAVMWDRRRQMLLTAGQRIKMWRPRKFFKTAEVTSHAAPVTCILYNPEFGQIVSSDAESNVCVWSAETGENTFGYDQVHGNDKITAMSFDISGRRLITGSDNGQCKMWNYNCGTALYELYRPPAFDRSDEPTQSELDAMDRLYAKSVQGSLDQTSVSSALVLSIDQHSTAEASQRSGVECSISDLAGVVQSGTDKELAAKYTCAAGSDRRIYLYDDQMPENADPDKPQMPLNGLPRHGDAGHDDDIQCLVPVPPTMLASCGSDGRIIIWDLATRRSSCTFNLRTEEHINDVNLFLQHQTNVMRLQGKAQRRRERLMGNDSSDEEGSKDEDVYADEPMSGITAPPESWKLNSTGGTDGQQNAFLTKMRQQYQRSAPTRSKPGKNRHLQRSIIEYEEKVAFRATVECMVLLPHLNCIVASGSDSIIRFWNLQASKLHYALRAWHPNNQTILNIATDEANQHIISACAIGYIRIWRVVHMGLENVLANKGLTPDDRTVLPVFSVAGWQAHDEALSCLKVAEHSLAGTLLITASGDCCINLWTIDGSKVGVFGQPNLWSLSGPDSWEAKYVEQPQLELPLQPGVAALTKEKPNDTGGRDDPSSPVKVNFESSILTVEQEDKLRGVEADMRYHLHKATINSRAEHREGHSDMREELRKSLTPGEARWEAHFYDRELEEKARTAAAMGEADIKVSSKHRDIGRELGHVAHELDLSKKRPESLHDKQRRFRERVTELKLQLPGQKASRRPSEVDFDGLMNAARNLGI